MAKSVDGACGSSLPGGTPQAAAAEAVRASEERLRLVTHATRCILTIAVVEADGDWRARALADTPETTPFRWGIEVIDEAAAQEVLPLDVPAGGLWYHAWLASRDPSDQRAASGRAGRALRDGEPRYRNTWRCTDRDGREHWQQQDATVEPLGEGRWRVTAITTDVTDLMLAERTARQALDQLSQVTRQTRCILNAGVVTAEPGWREAPPEPGRLPFDWQQVEVINREAAEEVLPLGVPEGERWQTVWHRHRDPESSRRANLNAYRAFRDGLPTFENELRCTDRHGREHWLSQVVTVEPLDADRWQVFGIATDCTARHRAESELRALLTNARCILWHADVTATEDWLDHLDQPDFADRVTWGLHVQDEHAAQQVVPVDILPGSTYANAWAYSRHPEDRARMSAEPVIELALARGERSCAQEFRSLDRAGRTVWQHEEISIEPLGERHWRLVGVVTDITALKLAEERLRAVLTNTRCILWQASVRGLEGWREAALGDYNAIDWRFAVADEEAAQQVVAVEVAAGQTFMDAVGDAALPGERARMAANARPALLAGDGRYRQEFVCRDRHGAVVWLHEDVTVRALGPDQWQAFGVVTDITASRQAAEELRTVLTNARCILWRAVVTAREGWRDDPENRHESLHWATTEQDERAAQQVLHLDVEPGGSHWRALRTALVEEDAWECNRHAHAALLAGAPRYLNEFRCIDRYGQTVWLREEATVQVLDPGRWLVVGVSVDVTERKLAEEERRELDRRSQQSQRLESLGVLAGGIAHDFNNLLMAILGNTELVRYALPPGSDEAQMLGRVETAAHRAADLCRQMLAYAGKGRVTTGAVDLLALVGELVHLLQASVTKRAQLQVDLPGALPPVWGDASQLRQIFMNLVINASEALGDRDGLIRVSAGEATVDDERPVLTETGEPLAPGGYVRLVVADNGCGMSAETLGRIFEPFFTTKFTGRGLGLSAVLGIVRGHKGALLVHSVEGEGTTFEVFLPAAPAAGASVPAQPVGDPRRGSGTILLAEDEAAVRETSSAMLHALGFDVLTATDGQDAVDQYRARGDQIDLVLLDMTMPRLSGEEALAQLRALDPAVKLVVASGHGETDLARRLGDAPVLAAIQKPYTLDTLRQVLVPLLPADRTP